MGDVSTQISSDSATEEDFQKTLSAIESGVEPVFLYTVFLCEYPKEEGDLSASQLAKRIVGIDQTIMFIFLICITVLTYIVNIDAENHRNQLFETYEFSIIITNLPEITNEYSVDQLKIDLWDKIEKEVKVEKQQIAFLKDS